MISAGSGTARSSELPQEYAFWQGLERETDVVEILRRGRRGADRESLALVKSAATVTVAMILPGVSSAVLGEACNVSPL